MRALMLASSLWLLSGCQGFSGPLMDPKVAWNPQHEGVWDPCPDYLPYQDWGAAEQGKVVCTARPDDPNFNDIDELTLP